WVEWFPRLRRQPEYRPLGAGRCADLSPHAAVRVVPHGLSRGQPLLVHRAGGDAAVAVAWDHTPPTSGQESLLRWLGLVHRFPHLAPSSVPRTRRHRAGQETSMRTWERWGKC